MSWKGESWADVVMRAAGDGGRPRARREDLPAAPRDPVALAASAQPWSFPVLGLELTEDGLVLGAGIESVSISLAQLYHLEPVDPWPAVAVGWVDRGQAYRTVLAPRDEDDANEAFARKVEAAVEKASSMPVTARGWLAIPELDWERVDALPGEGDAAPATGGYRIAPQQADPEIARRASQGAAALWTWVWARLRRTPTRVQPAEVVLTQRWLYVRTRAGERLRLPASALRTSWRTPAGDTVYLLGRSTELLLVQQLGCPLAAALDARVRPVEAPR